MPAVGRTELSRCFSRHLRERVFGSVGARSRTL